MIQRCIGCDARFDLDRVLYTCDACQSILEIELSSDDLRHQAFSGHGVWRYTPWLAADQEKAVTLSEGATGLHRCPRLEESAKLDALYIKNEGENPTGSFKDRGMTVGVTRAVQLGAAAVACASTGNTSASLAAFAARAGLRTIVLLPAGHVAMGKVAQAVAHGAELVQIDGNFDDAMNLVHKLSVTDGSVYLLNSINPFRLEGQKTLAYELCESLGLAPDTVVLPMGNAGNISAIWKGFREFHRAGLIERLPRMIGIQAANAAPIVQHLNGSCPECRVPQPETVATAIRIGAPVNWPKAVAAIRESGGFAATVTDRQILDAQHQLASREGYFVEPASAAPLAYLLNNRLRNAGTVVCVTTGHGLKDPDAVLKNAPELKHASPDLDALRRVLQT